MQLLRTLDLQSESLRFPTSFVTLTSVKFHLCNGSGTLTCGPSCQHCKQLARSSWTSFHSVKGAGSMPTNISLTHQCFSPSLSPYLPLSLKIKSLNK